MDQICPSVHLALNLTSVRQLNILSQQDILVAFLLCHNLGQALGHTSQNVSWCTVHFNWVKMHPFQLFDQEQEIYHQTLSWI